MTLNASVERSDSRSSTLARCPCCEATAARVFLVVGKYRMLRCAVCDLVYVYPQPTDDELSAFYESYFEAPSADAVRLAENREPVLRSCLGRIQGLVSTGSMVDVGAAHGDYLEMARSAGYGVFGIELASQPCSDMLTRGIPCYNGSLEDAPIERSSVDVITFWDTLEHLPEPLVTLRKARDILRPGGYAFATVPNRRFQTALVDAERLLGRDGSRRFEVPVHLNHFSARALRAVLEHAGFEDARVRPGYPSPVRRRLVHNAKRSLYTLASAANTLTGVNFGNSLFLSARAT